MKTAKLIRKSDGKHLVDRCLITESALERMRGLLGRAEMLPGEALLIEPCNSVHTFFMLFPIDVVFLDKSFKIIKVYNALKPWRLSPLHFRARSVLELPAGSASRLNLRQDEELELCDIS